MRILLADDHDLVLEGLKNLLERLQPLSEVVTARSLAEAIEIHRREGNFSVILLDLNMPGMKGLEGLRETLASFPNSCVAIITGLVSRPAATTVLASGAKGFIPKTLEVQRLVEAVQKLAAGEKYVPTDLMTGPMEPEGSDIAGGVPLTAREHDVATLLIKGMSNKEIARTLKLREVTVKLHIRNLFRKLATKNRTQVAVRLAQDGHFA